MAGSPTTRRRIWTVCGPPSPPNSTDFANRRNCSGPSSGTPNSPSACRSFVRHTKLPLGVYLGGLTPPLQKPTVLHEHDVAASDPAASPTVALPLVSPPARTDPS